MMIILLSQDDPYGYWKNPMIIPIGIWHYPQDMPYISMGFLQFFFVSSQAELAKAYRTLALKYHPVTCRQGGVSSAEDGGKFSELCGTGLMCGLS